VVDAAGEFVDHVGITRRTELRPVAFGINPQSQVSLHAPLSVHAAWVRLAFWIDFDPEVSTIFDPDKLELFLTAHVGGHTEEQYLQQQGSIPYAYNAYVDSELPEGAKIIKRAT
jgi:hypothetical protein